MSRLSFTTVSLLAALSFSSLLQAAEPVTIRLGDVKGDRYASLRASGELENLDYKVELTPFAAGAPVLEALNANALDVGFTGDIPFLFVHAAGAQLKAVGAWRYNTETVALVVPKDSAVQGVEDLKGKAYRRQPRRLGAFSGARPAGEEWPDRQGRDLLLPRPGRWSCRAGTWFGGRLGTLGALHLQCHSDRWCAGDR